MINKNADSKADGINSAERKDRAPEDLKGGRSATIPKRKRGYYRALLRHEPWALERRALEGYMSGAMIDLNKLIFNKFKDYALGDKE